MPINYVEIAMTLIFLAVLADASRCFAKDKKKMLMLALAFVYALIFENADMLISQGTLGSIVYSSGFAIKIWKVPLFAAMSWSVLLYTAMHLTDMLKLKKLSRPFMDALLVLLVELTFDVIALRQRFWSFVGYNSTQGWFGVPSDHLLGWMLLVFTFSFLFRMFADPEEYVLNRTERTIYVFMLPVLAYLSMLVLFNITNLIVNLLRLTKQQEIFILWAMVIVFAAVLRHTTHVPKGTCATDNKTIFIIILVRLLYFSYIIWAFVLTGIFLETIFLSVILLLSIIAEVLIHQAAFGHIGVKTPEAHH